MAASNMLPYITPLQFLPVPVPPGEPVTCGGQRFPRLFITALRIPWLITGSTFQHLAKVNEDEGVKGWKVEA